MNKNEKNIRQEIMDLCERLDTAQLYLFAHAVEEIALTGELTKSEELMRAYKSEGDFPIEPSPIDKAIMLFELWRDRTEERDHLSTIFRLALQMRSEDATEEDETELIGFVGALRMLGQI